MSGTDAESSQAPLLVHGGDGAPTYTRAPEGGGVDYEAPPSTSASAVAETRQSHVQVVEPAKRSRQDSRASRRSTRSASLARRMSGKITHLQIQLETLSPIAGRVLFYSWYFVLIAAFILSLVPWQWQCSNICGDDHCDLRKFDSWSSRRCARAENETLVNGSLSAEALPLLLEEDSTAVALSTYFTSSRKATLVHREKGEDGDDEEHTGGNNALVLGREPSVILGDADDTEHEVVWYGGFNHDFSTTLNRFVHFVLSIPRPPGVTGTVQYDVLFKIQLRDLGPAGGNSGRRDYDKFDFITRITFFDGQDRSDTVTLPTSTTSVSNRSRVVLTAARVPDVLVNSTVAASIAAVYQTRGYTITTIVVRYIMFVAVMVHMVRSTYHNTATISKMEDPNGKRPARFEQWWTLILEWGFVLYVNPLFAAGVFIVPQPGFFAFMEFRIPLYFVTLIVSFMFALISSATAWSRHQSPAPPLWSQAINMLLPIIVIVLDVIDAANHDWDWGLEHCPNWQCSTIGYIVYGTIIAYVIACTIWLRYLSNNLGRKSYLSSRPQQLAMRLFIFIFTTFAMYFVLSSLIIVAIYQGFAAVIPYQGLLQIGVILVSFAFVIIMKYSFTYVLRTDGVPFHPSDRRWKRVRWPAKWFQWVAMHGGGGYIFFSYVEEARFFAAQTGVPNPGSPTRSSARSSLAPTEDKAATKLERQRTDDSDSEWSDVSAMDDDVFYEDEASDAQAQSLHHAHSSHTHHHHNHPHGAPQVGYGNVDGDERDEGDDDKKGLLKTAVGLPARMLKRIEEGIVDTAVYFHLVNPTMRPFFNLETCIDALNLAWEAYGVNACAGDQTVTTGITVVDLLPPCCACCLRGADDDGRSRYDDSDTSTLAPGSPRQELSAVEYDMTPTPSRSNTYGTGFESPTAPLATSSRAREDSKAPDPTPPINTEQYGFHNVAVYTGLEVQVVISVMDTEIERHRNKSGCIAVAFRGTDNLSNAVQDVKFGLEEWDLLRSDVNLLRQATKVLRPRVHSGFLAVWHALREDVLTKVRDLRHANPNAKLLVTGHSLGGAVATFAAFELQKDSVTHERSSPGLFASATAFSAQSLLSNGSDAVGLSPPMVYTFGMPRVGNAAFRDIFDKRVPHFFRVVNESDAISHLSLMGGAHVGTEVDIDRHGNYIIAPMFIERLFRPIKGRGSSIRHHSMNGYAQSLNSITDHTGMGICPSRALQAYVDTIMMVSDMMVAATPRVGGGGDHDDDAAALATSQSVPRFVMSPRGQEPRPAPSAAMLSPTAKQPEFPVYAASPVEQETEAVPGTRIDDAPTTDDDNRGGAEEPSPTDAPGRAGSSPTRSVPSVMDAAALDEAPSPGAATAEGGGTSTDPAEPPITTALTTAELDDGDAGDTAGSDASPPPAPLREQESHDI